jgi:hypothetical protein
MGQHQEAQTYEIVCLEHQGNCLYAEMVQVIEERQRCWLRPLALSLVVGSAESNNQSFAPKIIDLRSCSDLLWPLMQIRAALDMEILPMLAMLQADKTAIEAGSNLKANQQLHAFLRHLLNASQVTEP